MRILYIFLLLIPTFLFTQSINLYNINTDKFPLIEADFFITESDGSQVVNVTTDEFIISENQRNKVIDDIICSPDSVVNNISTVLTLDLSSSMRGAKFDWIKEASSTWISQMDSSKEETAITTFDDEALLYADYNINKQSLLDIVQTLEVRDGTNFRTAFLDPYAGALDVARRAKYRPIIVFLTDGVGTSDFDVNEVVSFAREMNAVIYAVSLEISLPSEIKEVTDATGGLYFEEVNDREKLIEVYNTIRKIALSSSPCRISWFTDGCLLGKESKIEYKPLGISKVFNFNTPGIKPPEFEYLDDEFIEFSCQNSDVKTIRLKALNSDIEINSIDKVSGSNICDQFEATIKDRNTPFVLPKDSVIEIEISYLGTTSDYTLCNFTINSSTCLNVDFYAVSKCIGTPPRNNIIKVTRPNGGEVLQSGSKQLVFWDGTKQQQQKIVEYSTNNGINWNSIAQGKLQRSTEWTTPNIISNDCLIRVKQMSEEAGRKLYSLNIDSSNVNKITWNNAGNVFATLSDNDTLYIVNSVVGQIANKYKLDNTEDADISFLPDGVRLLFSSKNETAIINLITQEYNVISDFGGEIEISYLSDIGVIHNKDSVYILDLNTMNFVNYFALPSVADEITDAAISKSSDHIVISTFTKSRSDSLYILSKVENWSNYNQSSMIDDLFKYSYNFVEWSHDEEYIISTSKISNIKYLELWDFKNRKKIFKKIDPTFTEISDLATSYNDNYVVMTDAGFNVLVWEWDILVDTVFSLKYGFKSETIITNDIEWTKDGTRFAVGQSGFKSEKLLSIYSVKPYPEALDISDSTFSIVKNTFSIQNIDMGDALVNTSKDSIFNSIINYQYEFPIEIDSIFITGVDKESFSIASSPNLPYQIDIENQPNFIIEFKPNKTGAHRAIVTAYSEYGNNEFQLLGNGVQPIIKTISISFNEVNVDTEKKILNPAIINNGNSDLSIMSIEIVNPSSEQFQLYNNNVKVSEIENIDIGSNDLYNVNISFLPKDDIVYNSRIRVRYINEKGNADTVFIKLDGRGIRPILNYSDMNIGVVKCDEVLNDTIKVYNKGTGSLLINDIKLNSLNFNFNQNINTPYVLDEGDSLLVGVAFSPQDNGIINDSLIFISNNQSDSLTVVYLNGRKLETSYEIIGNTNLVGVDDDTPYNESVKVYNDGRTSLYWNTPSPSADGKIIINSVSPNPTLPTDTSEINYTFIGGNKGEVFKYKFAPDPICSDSIEINVEVKSTSPTLYSNIEDEFTIVCENELDISIPITNIGEAQLTIDSVSLTNNNENLFTIGNRIIQLNTNENDSLNIIFQHNVPGKYPIDIVIYSNDSKSTEGKTIIPITLIKEISKFNIIENEVTFSYLNNNQPNTKTVRVVNEGTVPIRWDVQIDNDFNIYDVEPQVAQPGDTSIITFVHVGSSEISNTFDLTVTDSCENKITIDINVLGIGSEQISVSIKDERRKIGEKFPLTLSLISSADFENSEKLKGNLIFNRTLISPKEKIGSTNGGLRVIPFEIINPKNNQIYTIMMEALWGNDSCTTIEISDLILENSTSNIEFSSKNGNLCIDDLCNAAGTRLLKVDFENQNNITINKYNDLELAISVNTIEKGEATLSIYNYMGTKLYQKSISNIDNIKDQILIDISRISSGNYYIQLETYSQIINKKLLIIK